MTTNAFDTHEAVKKLQEAGADERLAEALVNTMRQAGTAGLHHLATKADLYQVAIGIVIANAALTTALVKLL